MYSIKEGDTCLAFEISGMMDVLAGYLSYLEGKWVVPHGSKKASAFREQVAELPSYFGL